MYQCGEIPPGMYLVPEPSHGCWKEVYLNICNSMVINCRLLIIIISELKVLSRDR